MKYWLDSLETREQYFVSIGVAVAGLGLAYGLILAPLDRSHTTLRTDVDIWQESLEELRPLRNTTNAAGPNLGPTSAAVKQSPIIVVDQTLRSRGLHTYRKRSQPTTSNGIRVEFENVAFDDLVLWLGDLSSQYDMNVQAGSFSPGNRSNPGRINATVTLERAL
jgi:general secretion pathway protein M